MCLCQSVSVGSLSHQPTWSLFCYALIHISAKEQFFLPSVPTTTGLANQPMSSTTLRLLRLAHRVQLLLSVLAPLLCCMLKVLPARLQRAINNHLLRGCHQHHQQQAGLGLGLGLGMVSTRRQRSSSEGMQQVLERLHSISSQQQQHQPVSSKLAAVLVALFEAEDGAVRVWLTQRAQHLNSHQGDCVGDSSSPVPGCLFDVVAKRAPTQPSQPPHMPHALSQGRCVFRAESGTPLTQTTRLPQSERQRRRWGCSLAVCRYGRRVSGGGESPCAPTANTVCACTGTHTHQSSRAPLSQGGTAVSH